LPQIIRFAVYRLLTAQFALPRIGSLTMSTLRQQLYPKTLRVKTRNSAIADKPRVASRGQSRSANMVPFHMLRIVSY